LKIIFQVRKSKYDIVINVQRFFSSGLITSVSNAPIKSGFKKNPLSFFLQSKAPHSLDGTHEIERNQKLIEFITDALPAQPKIYITDPVEFEVRKYKIGNYICIAPASVWFTKQYPEDKWVEFIKQVKPDTTVYLLGSRSDSPICQRIAERAGSSTVSLCGELSLLESAALMKDALMNFVNDSAPLHLCSSVNAPVAAVFCSTVPRFGFGPVGSNGTIIETNEKLTCRPCGLHGRNECPEKHFNCAYTIAAQQLVNCMPKY
jgi:heptosyltransferase-2